MNCAKIGDISAMHDKYKSLSCVALDLHILCCAKIGGISAMHDKYKSLSCVALDLHYLCTMKELEIYSADTFSTLDLPFAEEGVRAGFPSPAQEYMESSIDLNRDLVRHPESTFYARVAGDSMVDADLNEGDILVIDKSLEFHTGDIAVCVVNGEFTVKTLEIYPDHVILRAANCNYPPLKVTEADSFEVWGVVTYVIKQVHSDRKFGRG